jgi:hypothetical protein
MEKKLMDLKKYTYSLDIFDLLGSDVEGVTPLSRGLFTPKKGAEEPEVKRDPAREMAQLTVAAFGGQDNARKYFGTSLPATSNDYSDLDPWREAALRSAEETELLKQDRGITRSLGLEDVERRNLTGNPFEGNQLAVYKAPPLPDMSPVIDLKRSLSFEDTPEEPSEEATTTITDPTTGRGLMSPQGGNSTSTRTTTSVGIKTPEDAYDIVGEKIGLDPAVWDIYRTELAAIESRGSGNYTAKGGAGDHYDGRYQLGRTAKADAGQLLGMDLPHDAASREAFRSNPTLQEQALAAYTAKNHQYMMSNEKYRNLSPENKAVVLGYAHNQGHGGAKEWLNTGDVGSDAWGTKGTKYSNAIANALSNYARNDNA